MSLLSNLKTYSTSVREQHNIQNGKDTNALSSTKAISSGREFTQGEIVKGQIIDLRNDQATIRLTDGSVIQGKMEQDVDLYIGQTTSFEVSKSNENGIRLRVISEQDVNQSNQLVDKALLQAGLPTSAKNKEVVNALLDSNLSIDKQNIMNLLKVVYQHPNSDVKDIVFLSKHNIPVDEMNLQMIQEYRNSEHRIVSQLQSLATSLGELLSDGTNTEGILKYLQFALDTPNYSEYHHKTMSSDHSMQEILSQVQVTTSGGDVVLGEEAVVRQEAILKEGDTIGLQVLNKDGQTVESATMIQEGKTAELAMIQEGQAVDFNVSQGTESRQNSIVLQNSMTMNQLQRIASAFEQLGVSKEFINQLKNGSVTGHECLETLYELVKNQNIHGKAVSELNQLLQSEEFQKIFKEEILHNFTLSPKQIENGDNVKKLYEKLEQDLNNISELMNQSTKSNDLAKLNQQTEHLKNNLDFMKTLNQIYPYIQLPVRLKNQNIHSELYVFTKHRGKLSTTEDISVLLHLDMDHIGALDIHLQLNKSNLKAKFYVEDEEVKELFQQTIEELNTALKDMGYQVYSEFALSKKHSNVLEEMTLQEQASEGLTMKRYTFDIRA